MKKSKKYVSFMLMCLMILSGNVSININALSGDKHTRILYITDKDNVNSNVTTYYGKKNNIDNTKNTKVNAVKPDSVSDSVVDNYDNICTDDSLSCRPQLNKIVRKSFQDGKKVILRKNDAKLKDLFQNLGITNLDDYANTIDTSTDNKLKVVGVSVKKDNDGTLRTKVIRVQSFENQDEVDEAIAYSVEQESLDNKDSNSSLLSSNVEAHAAVLDEPDWNKVAYNTWVDYWDSIIMNYGVNLETDPSGPSSGVIWYINYTNVTETPRPGYAIGQSYFLCNGGGTDIVQNYGPTAMTSNSAYITFGAGVSMSCYFNNTMNISCTGMTGTTYTQWCFNPVSSLGTSTLSQNQLYEQLCTLYHHPVSGPYNTPTGGLTINFNYSVYTYIYAGVGFGYYGLASSSVRSVSTNVIV